jgi:hypothetical protein
MIALRIFSAFREIGQRQVQPIDLIVVYFWITAILHYLFSLSYCPDCIIPYTNYFLPVGALAAAGLIGEIFRLTRDPRSTYAMLGAVLVIAVTTQASPSFPTLLRPRSDNIRTAALELSTQLRPILSATTRVLVLCDSVEASQAVWLAGGIIEPRSLFLPANFREPKSGLTKDEYDRIDSTIWDAGYWSESSMRRALTEGYQMLLIERRKNYRDGLGRTVRDGIPFGDLVAAHFQLVASPTAGDRTFELYRRRG